MPAWKQLEGDLSRWLANFATPGIDFRGSHQAIPGFPPDGFRSDGCLSDGQTLLAVEVEAGQIHPDTNVGKYWYLGQFHRYERIVLFHIYTPDFNSYGWRKALGEFYARTMQDAVPLEYVQLDYRNAEDYAAAFEEIRSTIEPVAADAFAGAK